MSRHTARIHAFNLIFQLPFYSDWSLNRVGEYLESVHDLEEHLHVVIDENDKNFITSEVSGIFANQQELDAIISKYLKDWDLERIAKVDLALLRLALYEIYHVSDISTATAINEVVEIAKVYGADESPAFINGLLGQAVRENA